MHFTEEAQNLFHKAMEEIGKDVFHIELVQHGCGGKGLNLKLITKEEATRIVEIDGIAVDISEDDDAFLKEFTFEEYNGNIKVVPPAGYKPGCHGGSTCDDCEDCGDCDHCH